MCKSKDKLYLFHWQNKQTNKWREKHNEEEKEKEKDRKHTHTHRFNEKETKKEAENKTHDNMMWKRLLNLCHRTLHFIWHACMLQLYFYDCSLIQSTWSMICNSVFIFNYVLRIEIESKWYCIQFTRYILMAVCRFDALFSLSMLNFFSSLSPSSFFFFVHNFTARINAFSWLLLWW